MKKKEQKSCFKNLLKNNILSVILFIIVISTVAVFAGNVYVTDGDVAIDDDLKEVLLALSSDENKLSIKKALN